MRLVLRSASKQMKNQVKAEHNLAGAESRSPRPAHEDKFMANSNAHSITVCGAALINVTRPRKNGQDDDRPLYSVLLSVEDEHSKLKLDLNLDPSVASGLARAIKFKAKQMADAPETK